MTQTQHTTVTTAPERTDQVVMRLVTLGGAVVTVTRLAEPQREQAWWDTAQTVLNFGAWRCGGCGEGGTEDTAKRAAKPAREHAASCRALPASADAAAPPSADAHLIANALQDLAIALAETQRRPWWRRRGGGR